MHPIGGAHAFEYNSIYIMDSGHIAVEVSTLGADQIREFNPNRYGDIQINPTQTSEVLAQASALIKSPQSPIAELNPRKVILWGTSASSAILTRYLDAHAIFTLADGSNIYDGFMPTSNGSDIEPVDVPMIQVPTQHEFGTGATSIQDGDAYGGIRNPYVDLAAYKYTMVNVPTEAAMNSGAGVMGPALLCRLSGWQTPIAQDTLRSEYRSTRHYVNQFENRLNELEAAGWSLPVYHDLIMADARKVQF